MPKCCFGSLPYFYFRFRLYGHRDGRFCLIFARRAQQSVLDCTNELSSSKSSAYCRIVWSELKPEVVSATIINPERCIKPQNAYKWAELPCLQVLLAQRSFSVSCKVGSHIGSRNIKPEVVFKVQKMARYALFCLIMDPFKGAVPVFARLWPIRVKVWVSFTTGAS